MTFWILTDSRDQPCSSDSLAIGRVQLFRAMNFDTGRISISVRILIETPNFDVSPTVNISPDFRSQSEFQYSDAISRKLIIPI
jgi:hypothetical protein